MTFPYRTMISEFDESGDMDTRLVNHRTASPTRVSSACEPNQTQPIKSATFHLKINAVIHAVTSREAVSEESTHVMHGRSPQFNYT
jgi:hypothetical protein